MQQINSAAPHSSNQQVQLFRRVVEFEIMQMVKGIRKKILTR
ncbi:hypothetical protein [Leptolyngbya iicbica]|nr:hypothetical protein [Leptolyngbya sp. LK]